MCLRRVVVMGVYVYGISVYLVDLTVSPHLTRSETPTHRAADKRENLLVNLLRGCHSRMKPRLYRVHQMIGWYDFYLFSILRLFFARDNSHFAKESNDNCVLTCV